MPAPVVALLLLAIGPPLVVFDGELVVPRSRARGIPVKIERPTYVEARFEAGSREAQVRAALLTAADVHAFQEGRPHELLAVTAHGAAGEFRFLAMRPGEYYVLIDNRLDAAPEQKVHVVVTSREDPSLPGTVPVSRRHWISAMSAIFFAVVAGWSGWRLRGVRLLR